MPADYQLPDSLRRPHPERLVPGAPGYGRIVAAHEAALREGADGYVDPVGGMFCFTAAYHWRKGFCCELGCRHCPWVERPPR